MVIFVCRFCESFGEHTCALLLSIFLEVELLEPRICVFSGLADTTNGMTYRVVTPLLHPFFFFFLPLQQSMKVPGCSVSL